MPRIGSVLKTGLSSKEDGTDEADVNPTLQPGEIELPKSQLVEGDKKINPVPTKGRKASVEPKSSVGSTSDMKKAISISWPPKLSWH